MTAGTSTVGSFADVPLHGERAGEPATEAAVAEHVAEAAAAAETCSATAASVAGSAARSPCSGMSAKLPTVEVLAVMGQAPNLVRRVERASTASILAVR